MKPNTLQLTIRIKPDQKEALHNAHNHYMQLNNIEVSFNSYVVHLIETTLKEEAI